MNESIGNTFIFNLVIAFVAILIILFLGGIAYTKAYKVKNMIVNELEAKGEDLPMVCNSESGTCDANRDELKSFTDKIDSKIDTSGVGYRRISSYDNSHMCQGNHNYIPHGNYISVTEISGRNDYHYCIYEIPINTGTSSDSAGRQGYYFRVVTFMYVDLPVIDNLIKIPVTGETETFYTWVH